MAGIFGELSLVSYFQKNMKMATVTNPLQIEVENQWLTHYKFLMLFLEYSSQYWTHDFTD